MIKVCKGLLLGFWLMVVGSLYWPLPAPWASTVLGVAAVLLGVHLLEIGLYRKLLARQPQPWRQGLQVLAFGVLQLKSLR